MYHPAHPLSRFISWLVLVCFYFQILWPSVVFAADVDVMRPISPHAFFGRYAPEDDVIEEEGRIAFEIQIDNKGEAFDPIRKRPAAFIPVGRSLEETQKLIDEDLSLRRVYPGLKVQTDGLAWEQLGYSFHFHVSGNLLVSGKGATEDRSLVLRLYNPYGSVVLGKDLALEQLWVGAHHVIQVEKNSIKRLNVWAEGDSTSLGTFTNTSAGSLHTTQFFLHQGKFVNQGIASLADGGILNLYNQDYENHGLLELGRNARLLGVKTLTNTEAGLIQGTTASFGVDTFYNHHLIHLTNDLSLGIATLFQNKKTGSVVIGGNVTVSGTGSIIIEEGSTEKAGIAVDGHLVFDKLQAH